MCKAYFNRYERELGVMNMQRCSCLVGHSQCLSNRMDDDLCTIFVVHCLISFPSENLKIFM